MQALEPVRCWAPCSEQAYHWGGSSAVLVGQTQPSHNKPGPLVQAP